MCFPTAGDAPVPSAESHRRSNFLPLAILDMTVPIGIANHHDERRQMRVTQELLMSRLPTIFLRHLQGFPFSLSADPVREVRNVLRRMRKIHERKTLLGAKDENPRGALVKASRTKSSALVFVLRQPAREVIKRVKRGNATRSKSPQPLLSALTPHPT